MVKKSLVLLQFGVNVFAEKVYENYRPPKNTAYYPDPEAVELRGAISNYTGYPPEMIICGNGSDELIDLYIRIRKLNSSALKIAVVPPNYYQYDNYSARIGCEVVRLAVERAELTPALLMSAGCTAKNSVVMLDSPSNPAGEVTPREVFINLLEAGYRVLADEAYYEFCGQTVADLVPLYPRQLVVSRSLSKIAAMAGSRLGYFLADSEIIAEFQRHKLLFNTTAEAQARALFALQHMPEFIKSIDTMRAAKAATERHITAHKKLQLLPSLDMYVIFKHHQLASDALHKLLAEMHGVMTYLYHGFKGEDVVRATVGASGDMQRLHEALAQV